MNAILYDRIKIADAVNVQVAICVHLYSFAYLV